MQTVNLHARPSIKHVVRPTCCYQVCALDHAKGVTTDLDYHSEACHRNDITGHPLHAYDWIDNFISFYNWIDSLSIGSVISDSRVNVFPLGCPLLADTLMLVECMDFGWLLASVAVGKEFDRLCVMSRSSIV